jgi:hypothetical protein
MLHFCQHLLNYGVEALDGHARGCYGGHQFLLSSSHSWEGVQGMFVFLNLCLEEVTQGPLLFDVPYRMSLVNSL